jgi:hypothetical protein
MKRIVLTATIAAFSMTAINAQEVTERKHEKPALHEKQKDHFKNDFAGLNLSVDQKAKMKSLKEAHHLQMDELKKQNASEEKMEAIRKEHHDQLLSILTTDQKAELDKIKEERKDISKEKMTLVEEKKAPATNQQQEIAAKIKAIQLDESLTQEQKNTKTKELVQLMKETKKAEVSPEETEKFKQQKKHNLEKKTTEKKEAI